MNRNFAFLRAAFNWAIVAGLVERSPFKRGTQTVVKLSKEAKRTRRLQDGEEARLLAACGTHLRAVVECALESGMRVGEILSLQWADVAPQAREIRLTAAKTKTRTGRTIPISTRLQAILDMRRLDPTGQEQPITAYVFGNEIGQRIKSVQTAWRTACRRAGIQDLHVHDLRRECGSRWVDTGVPLHQVQKWLGHTNISQTSTYLQPALGRAHDAMREHEERWRALQQFATGVGTGGHTEALPSTSENRKPQETTTGHGPH